MNYGGWVFYISKKQKPMAVQPIWKDYFQQLGEVAADSVVFFLQDDNNINTNLYQGTAYTRPGETIPTARINDLVAPHLIRGFTPIGETDVPYFAARVQVGEDDDYQYTVYFCADWSYDPDFDPETDDLNDPICDILMPGQWVPCTLAADGTASFAVLVQGLAAGEYNADFNADFSIYGDVWTTSTVANNIEYGTAWLQLSLFPTASKVTVNGRTYRVGGGCHQFVLYYVNAYGGWDTLVVQGNTKETDSVTRHTAEVEYDNSHTYSRGSRNYVNELAHKYTFYTHYLTEEQSLKMHHLLNSPLVYLHDVVAGQIRPVVLTGSTTEYKKNGRLYQYTIEATLAQERTRR